ncbi:ATP-binding protein [Methylobacterium sp. Leaf465]|uniref:AAA family ATPase n=1 Tax=Methylobacterium sp. Leaf465 TaxID=1736385 RepID=UPI0009E74C2C|nr:ATP-binding protein [Methylobacterium sp. Leaf465]
MKTVLSVRKFSCIATADIELSALTILIGPQASGKSVLSKLTHFCFESYRDMMASLYAGEDFEEHKQSLVSKFKRWFPVSAWGTGDFTIRFVSGDFVFSVVRSKSRNAPSEKIRIVYAEHVQPSYDSFLRVMIESTRTEDTSPQIAARRVLDQKNKIVADFERQLDKISGVKSITWQVFIPAGRSFFTSQYRTQSAFNRAELLDPLLIEFGQLYAYVKDHGGPKLGRSNAEGQSKRLESPIVNKLLGGDIIFGEDSSFLETGDGRTLPFSFLSSGQQELLPLLLTIEVFGVGNGTLTYIEEPEAHLFPESQSVLLKHLVSLMKKEKSGAPQIFITTHSPYILSRINNLIKAGQLGVFKEGVLRKKIAGVVPEKSWILPGTISAYAIEDGQVRDIVDEDGFVNAEYLDAVSNDISRELSKIIQIELDHEYSEDANG